MSDSYRIQITEEAEANLAKIDRSHAKQIGEKIRWLAANIEDVPHQALKGKKWAGLFRYRVGDYRFIYYLDHEQKILMITRVGHRKNVYDE
ncbi:MAG: type II toxin-antitoxin system RelE/ParE family toxin [Anaerolineae bacterium]|nr:type II toxin-antitoxin system RelE/ParE family toxin [Anaerolineae bacterium]